MRRPCSHGASASASTKLASLYPVSIRSQRLPVASAAASLHGGGACDGRAPRQVSERPCALAVALHACSRWRGEAGGGSTNLKRTTEARAGGVAGGDKKDARKKKRFSYRSFAQRVGALDTNVFRKVGSARAEPAHGAETFFQVRASVPGSIAAMRRRAGCMRITSDPQLARAGGQGVVRQPERCTPPSSAATGWLNPRLWCRSRPESAPHHEHEKDQHGAL
jgi:hypothetical protein